MGGVAVRADAREGGMGEAIVIRGVAPRPLHAAVPSLTGRAGMGQDGARHARTVAVKVSSWN